MGELLMLIIVLSVIAIFILIMINSLNLQYNTLTNTEEPIQKVTQESVAFDIPWASIGITIGCISTAALVIAMILFFYKWKQYKKHQSHLLELSKKWSNLDTKIGFIYQQELGDKDLLLTINIYKNKLIEFQENLSDLNKGFFSFCKSKEYIAVVEKETYSGLNQISELINEIGKTQLYTQQLILNKNKVSG